MAVRSPRIQFGAMCAPHPAVTHRHCRTCRLRCPSGVLVGGDCPSCAHLDPLPGLAPDSLLDPSSSTGSEDTR